MLLAILGAMLVMAADLPAGPAPPPVALPHFPDRLHAFVWRNWPLVPTARLAQTVGAKPADIVRMGEAMGFLRRLASRPRNAAADPHRHSAQLASASL